MGRRTNPSRAGPGRRKTATRDIVGAFIYLVWHRIERVPYYGYSSFDCGQAQHGDLERPAVEERFDRANYPGAGTADGRRVGYRVGVLEVGG
jgi:hypothetical protein